jgi:hypothetical protein
MCFGKKKNLKSLRGMGRDWEGVEWRWIYTYTSTYRIDGLGKSSVLLLTFVAVCRTKSVSPLEVPADCAILLPRNRANSRWLFHFAGFGGLA